MTRRPDLGGRFRGKLRWTSAGAVVVVGAVLAGTVLASAASPVLPRRSAAQLLVGMRHAVLPGAFAAVVSQSANLGFPALPDIGGVSSSLLSAASLVSGTHTVQIWYDGPRHVRIAMPVPFGETDLRVNGDQVWLWNSHGQTATHLVLPAVPRVGAVPGSGRSGLAGLTPPQAARRVLDLIGPTTKVTVAGPVTVAGRAAYQLSIAPRSGQSLIGQILIAVDAKSYLPLQVQVFPRGSSSAAFQVGFTSLTFGTPAMSNFSFTPPPGAHVKTIRPGAPRHGLAAGARGPAGGPGSGGGLAGGPGLNPASLAGGPAMNPVDLAGGQRFARSARGPATAGAHSPRSGPLSPVAGPHGRVPGPAGPAGGVQILGSGWLTVAVIPAGRALAGQPGVGGQAIALLRVLLNAAAPVHGAWGRGRLLSTSLFSVLITSKGKVLIGAVNPVVLYADAAKVK